MPDPDKMASEYYRFLGAFYLYQDQLSWSRIQTVIAIEAAALAIVFGRAERGWPGVCILAAVATLFVFRLMTIDRRWRDDIASKMQTIHTLNGEIEAMKPDPRGQCILRLAGSAVVVLNIILAVLVWAKLL